MGTWLTINSILIAVVAFALYLTIRQVGVVLSYVGPIGVRELNSGPRIGENIAVALRAEREQIRVSRKPQLLVFGSKACGVCKHVRHACEQLAPVWQNVAEIALIYDEANDDGSSELSFDRSGLQLLGETNLRQRLDINTVPYAVAVNAEGIVIGKGLVNIASHVESLLELITQESSPGATNQWVEGGIEDEYAWRKRTDSC